ncbi:hypothetical protein P5673_021297 [Acropora cervicornis]|uniref:Ig-like domain-containing protein n=1 Tax=Acropora cervicornis TaxID=6130 RepID=A0AAD9Q8P1_ACRCE|nr:hypothetical protein P5673_021297 [Acropora cervicornis]
MDNLAGKIVRKLKDALELDYSLTRKEIITFIGQAANLACYTTNTNAPMTYSWTKSNQIVNESSNVRIFDNVLVITPTQDTDFGNYMCNISNGASNSKTGCVNISVLMPVLAVAVMSLLLFIHLLIRGKRAQDNLRDRKMKHNEECSSRHSEASTSVIEEPIELQANGYVSSAHHANGHVPRTPMNGRALSHSPGA